MPKFDHILSVVYLSLRSPQLFENDLDMMCIRKGNYARSKLIKKSSIFLAVPNLQKVSHK